MKPFNLEEYLANPSKKVVTRKGLDVRIVYTDVKCDYPVIGLVNNNDRESVYIFTKDGKWMINLTENGKWNINSYDNKDLDLFFYNEKHEGWAIVYKNVYKQKEDVFLGNTIFKSREVAEINKDDNSIAIVKIEWDE